MLTRDKTGDQSAVTWAGFDKPRAMWRITTTPAITAGSEFHYNAARSRVMQLEFDSVSGTFPNQTPLHYNRKRLYALGSTLELNYNNTTTSGTGQTWNLNKVRIYVPGPDGIVGAREFDVISGFTGTEKSLVYHYDHLGSITAITNYGTTALAADIGAKPGKFSEDAWGQRRNPFTWSGAPLTGSNDPNKSDDGGFDSLTPRGYTGHEMLDDLGLIHMNGRIYDPLLGRFLSADVMVQNPASLQSFNRYSYVMNNPLSLVDPSGFQTTVLAPDPVTAEEMAEAVRLLYQETPPNFWPLVTVSLPFMLIKGDSGPRPPPSPKPAVAPTAPDPNKRDPANPSKPQQPAPHEVKIDDGAIQSNGQGDKVKTTQSSNQEAKPDAPKTEPKKDDAKSSSDGKDSKDAAAKSAKGIPGKDLPGKGGDWIKLKGNQGWKDADGNIWKKDQLHKDHWDVSDSKGNKIREVDFKGEQIWPDGPKNKNKKP